MPIQIQGPGATESLRRAFGFVGRLVPRLDETISPVALVADISREAPPGVLHTVISAAGVTGVAAEQSWVRIQASRGTLCVLTRIHVGAEAATQMVGACLNVPSALVATGVGSAQFTDGRVRDQTGNATPACSVATGTDAVAIAAPFLRFTAPALPDMRTYEMFLPFGGRAGSVDQFIFSTLTNDLDLRVGLEWIEYPQVAPVV